VIGVDEDLINTEYYAAPEVMKWYVEYYPFLKPDEIPLEGIQEPGEVIFVPSGWWHTVGRTLPLEFSHVLISFPPVFSLCWKVLNLEETIAVTQNFCSTRTFDMSWHDLLVRGPNSLMKHFREAVEPKYPHLFAQFEAKYPHVKPKEDSSDSDTDSD
jgi:hypothetical protein